MPHQCVRCGEFYGDGTADLLKGCSKCGGKFFFFVKKEIIEEAKTFQVNLTEKDKTTIEKDVYDIIGITESDKPVILDLESIRILKPGQYQISLVDLFKGKPLVFRLEEGKYVIDLASTFSGNIDDVTV